MTDQESSEVKALAGDKLESPIPQLQEATSLECEGLEISKAGQNLTLKAEYGTKYKFVVIITGTTCREVINNRCCWDGQEWICPC